MSRPIWDTPTQGSSMGMGNSGGSIIGSGSSMGNSSINSNNGSRNSSTSNLLSNSSNMGNSESIRKDIRKLEVDVDTKLSQMSSLNDKVQRESNFDSFEDCYIEFDVLTSELDSIFKNLTRYNEILAKEPNISSSMIQHHRDKLEDFLKDYRMLKKNIPYALEKADLMSGSTYNNKKDHVEIPMNNLLREQSSLQSSNYVADSILGQARQAHEALENQRRILRGTHGKINQMPDLFQTIDGVTSKIRRMKNRNLVVLGTLIGLCICFLLYYSLRY